MNNKVIARARPVHITVAGRILRQKSDGLAIKNSHANNAMRSFKTTLILFSIA
jgi:hypothetical protein